MKINVDGTEGELKKLDTTAPQGVVQPKLSGAIEATIDDTPQPLRRIRPYAKAQVLIPGLLPKEAQVVLHLIFSCFEKQKEVQEGLIGDLVWGFEQCGTPATLTIVGLISLGKNGYVKFQAKDNSYVDFESDKIEGCFVRYQKKLLDMVYEPLIELRTR